MSTSGWSPRIGPRPGPEIAIGSIGMSIAAVNNWVLVPKWWHQRRIHICAGGGQALSSICAGRP